MSWSSRRRSLYFLIFFIAVAAIAGGILYSFFYEAPTCTDGIQNGMEEGVDCGGGCPIICSFSAAEPIVHFSRLFEIIPGVYTVVALVENPNPSVAAYDLPYTFKLRGTDSILVKEEKGVMYLPAKGVVPVFVAARGEDTAGGGPGELSRRVVCAGGGFAADHDDGYRGRGAGGGGDTASGEPV